MIRSVCLATCVLALAALSPPSGPDSGVQLVQSPAPPAAAAPTLPCRAVVGPNEGQKVSKEFALPFRAAREAIIAKESAAARSALAEAAPHAKTETERLAVVQLETAVNAVTGDKLALIQSIEAQLLIAERCPDLLSAQTAQAHRATLRGLRDELSRVPERPRE